MCSILHHSGQQSSSFGEFTLVSLLPCFQPTELSHIWCLHPLEGEEIDLANLAAARRKSQHLSLGTSLSVERRQIETPACPYLPPRFPCSFSIPSLNLFFSVAFFSPFHLSLQLFIASWSVTLSMLEAPCLFPFLASVFVCPSQSPVLLVILPQTDCLSLSHSTASFSLLWFHSFN